jgi:hypothetical protein
MGRHAEGQDLMLNAVVLEMLVEVALMAVECKQSVVGCGSTADERKKVDCYM